jgi:hypothetical protein
LSRALVVATPICWTYALVTWHQLRVVVYVCSAMGDAGRCATVEMGRWTSRQATGTALLSNARNLAVRLCATAPQNTLPFSRLLFLAIYIHSTGYWRLYKTDNVSFTLPYTTVLHAAGRSSGGTASASSLLFASVGSVMDASVGQDATLLWCVDICPALRRCVSAVPVEPMSRDAGRRPTRTATFPQRRTRTPPSLCCPCLSGPISLSADASLLRWRIFDARALRRRYVPQVSSGKRRGKTVRFRPSPYSSVSGSPMSSWLRHARTVALVRA